MAIWFSRIFLDGSGWVYSGDGGQAVAARLNEPFHCELDGKGGLYIAEAMNQCVRRVDLKTGVITTVAGTGGDTLISGSVSPTWTVNGMVRGNLCTPANEWQRWRVLLADADASPKTLAVGAGCEVALLARDGVWRTVAPRPLPARSIDLTGASRADLAVRCSADSTLSVGGTVVATVYADDGIVPNTGVGPYSDGATGTTWSARRPDYLRDLRSASSVERRTVKTAPSRSTSPPQARTRSSVRST